MEDERLSVLKANVSTIESEYSGGVMRFKGLTCAGFEKLMALGYIKPNDSQDSSPTAKEFLAFMQKWKSEGVTAHGHIVSNDRKDARITIEGLQVPKPNFLRRLSSILKPRSNFLSEWREFNSEADQTSDTFSWWD